MNIEEFVDALKELTRCYDYCNDEESPQNKEISMWRNKFLIDNNISDIYIKKCFINSPSEYLLSYESPEEYLKGLKKV